MNSAVVFGSSGSIGNALVLLLAEKYPKAIIYSVSRFKKDYTQKNISHLCVDYFDEVDLQTVAQTTTKSGPLDLVLVSNGMLHNDTIKPEKSLKDISIENLQISFKINTTLPALLLKHFMPALNRKDKSIFAVLSARVGSISDNRLGGWYGYRASKSALNMMIKTASIEAKRSNKSAIVVGLHPGTVDSELSKPFQKNISPEKVMLPNKSAEHLLSVLSSLSCKDSGKCFAWDGEEILP